MRESNLCFASFSSRWAFAKGFSLSFMVSYCRETHPVDASWAVGLSRRLLLRSLLLERSRRLRSLLLRSLLLLLERSRRRRPILAPLRYSAAARAPVKHSHSRAALKAGCSVPRRVISRARPVSWLEMIYSVTRFVALHLFTRARASQSVLPGSLVSYCR